MCQSPAPNQDSKTNKRGSDATRNVAEVLMFPTKEGRGKKRKRFERNEGREEKEGKGIKKGEKERR